jgi:F-type H+-transporting ATPase subunit gamma
MAAGKEIRGKIKSVENTKKITKAMEMVAASKMRKAQDRMRAARPYSDKVRRIVANLREANLDYLHPYQLVNDSKTVGLIIVTTDKGLCGGLNTNLLRCVTQRLKALQEAGYACRTVAIGQKGLGFLNRMRVPVVAQVTQLGDKVHLDHLIGPVKTLLDSYIRGELLSVELCYSRFINTMKQEAVIEPLLPLSAERLDVAASLNGNDQSTDTGTMGTQQSVEYGWDYLYEPSAPAVIDALMVRYVEALVYQSVAENMACEQSARMVAMKAATENAAKVIDELKLAYNKTRQAAITKELSEIVAGAAAV